MVNKKYSMAITETLHYLKGINQNDINKIPNKFIEFLKSNADHDYECNFDYTKSLKDLELMAETRGLISMICLNYICENDQQKKAYINHLKENEIRYQEELRKKYNPDNIFQKNSKNIIEQSETISKEKALIEIKEGIIAKFIKKLKNIFHTKFK